MSSNTLSLYVILESQNYNNAIVFMSSRNFVQIICTYIMHTLHCPNSTLPITHIQPSYYKLQHNTYGCWDTRKTLNKPTIPSIVGWWYVSSKGDRFDKSLHVSTHILLISHPMPPMANDLCWSHKLKESRLNSCFATLHLTFKNTTT